MTLNEALELFEANDQDVFCYVLESDIIEFLSRPEHGLELSRNEILTTADLVACYIDDRQEWATR